MCAIKLTIMAKLMCARDMDFLRLQARLLLIQILFVSSSCFQFNQTLQQSRHMTIVKQKPVSQSCPPWKYQKYHNSSCVCGDTLDNIVGCEDAQPTVKILTCHCMSYGDRNETILVGDCPYRCTDRFYTVIHNQTDIADLCNRDIQQNRQGLMCGKCVDNFAPSAYSYTFECADCSNYKHNWIKYILMTYLPLTFLYILVVVIRFNALSASMNSFILTSQIVGSPAAVGLVAIYEQFNENDPEGKDVTMKLSVNILSSIYGIWNLDFLRRFYLPFCLHPNMSILQIFSLDLATAVYPICLICITHFLMKLHDISKAVQCLCKPAQFLLSCVNYQRRTSTSLIEVFGTFLLLSYVKIINTSFDILMPVQLYNVSGDVVGWHLYYNGSLKYFGHDHLPYAVLASVMFITFNFLPLLLLCLYPCQCFQSCLNCFRLNSQVLRTFIDVFQGCYKFEPYDCRYWAAFYMFLRILFMAVFALTKSGYYLLVAGTLLIPVVALLAVVRPYRQNIYNVIDVLMLLSLILLCFSAAGFPLATFDQRYESYFTIMFGSAVFFPVMYITGLLLKYIIPRRLMAATQKCLQCALCKDKLKYIITRRFVAAIQKCLQCALCKDSKDSDLNRSEEACPLLIN